MGKIAKTSQEAMLTAEFITKPTYVAFCTNATIDDDTLIAVITEPTDTAYVRKQVSFGAVAQEAMDATTKSVIRNSAKISMYTQAANASTPITHVLFMDSVNKGTGVLKAWHKLTTPLNPTAGQPIEFALGALFVAQD